MWLNKKKKIGLTILFISGIILLAVILIYAFSNGQPKTPATCQQVSLVLSELGYEPSDTTSLYLEDDSRLTSSVAIENEKIRFDFFEFDNENSADNVYDNACNLMLDYRSSGNISNSEGYANYYMHSLKSNGVYYITIRVENTALYAYCDEDYMSELGKILSGIGYSANTEKDK
ncbi:MAG: hypothetical protein K2H13_09840 [Eubacterium sp.]|nr:hypothetical protein [Eubacterium sp.]